jgi:predicted small lipoprotein YifL
MKRARRSLLSLVSLLALLGLVGCGRSAKLATPDGFAPLSDQESYAYRAANAEGVVIGVREEKNDPPGNLAFWTGVIDNHLRRRGYVRKNAEGGEALTSIGGIPGKKLVYERDNGGRVYDFWAAVYVTDAKVYVVEAGGDRELVHDADKTALEKALTSLEP